MKEINKWVSKVKHRAVTQACSRVKTWPPMKGGRMTLRAVVKYSSGTADDHTWVLNHKDRGQGDDRALVLVYANSVLVDSYYATVGKSEVSPTSHYTRVWWMDQADDL